MKTILLALIVTTTHLSSLSAQELRSVGELSQALGGRSALLIAEGNCAALVMTPIFEALRQAGVTVVLDGERRREYSGLVTTVSVADTSFSRRGSDVAFRQLHATSATDYLVAVYGDFGLLDVGQLVIHFIDRATGRLELVIEDVSPRTDVTYSQLSLEIAKLINPDWMPTSSQR